MRQPLIILFASLYKKYFLYTFVNFGDAMSYSFTEKKRLRKNFANATVAEVLIYYLCSWNLIRLPTNGFPVDQERSGFTDTFNSVFPFQAIQEMQKLDFVSYSLGKLFLT